MDHVIDRERQLATLRYWMDVEGLIAPDAGKEERERYQACIPIIDERLPWLEQGAAPGAAEAPLPRIHYVRFGVMRRRAYEEALRATLDARADAVTDGGRRQVFGPLTYLGVFAVEDNGRGLAFDPLEHLAAFGPYFAELRGRDAAGYALAMARRFDELREAVLADPDRRVDLGFIRALAEAAIELLDWPVRLDGAVHAVVLSKATQDDEGRPRDHRLEPVNGFFLDQLTEAAAAVRAGRPCGLVPELLKHPDPAVRSDCLDAAALTRALAAERLPPGRWPAAFPLTLMPQVAVNEALSRLAEGGIVSVNGPPGTGKTTLLQDIVAAVLVQRAAELAAFATPEAAFGEPVDPDGCYPLRFHASPVVVASSNNGAVENVTRELPDLRKVAPEFRAPEFRAAVERFLPTAQALLSRRRGAHAAAPGVVPAGRAADETPSDDDQDLQAPEGAAWGLISAPLGARDKRSAFCRVLRQKVPDPDDPTTLIDGPANIFRQLHHLPRMPWQRSCDEFRAALAAVERPKAELDRRERLMHDRPGQEDRAARAGQAHEKASAAAEEARRRMASAAGRLEATRLILRSLDDDLARLRRGITVSVLARLGSVSARHAVARRRELDERRHVASDRLRDALGSVDDLRTALDDAERLARAAQADKEAKRLTVDQARAAVGAIAAAHGRVHGLAETIALPYDQQHQRLPGSSDALDRARALVFVRALGVHQALISGARSAVRKNLSLALAMVAGKLSPSPARALDLWGTLALVVPVLSSTFSSFKRCFDTVPAGGLDWLIVDEAGQAVPQHAVGALMRARRALVVGDPLQVEPVITLDRSVDERLLRRCRAPVDRHLAAGGGRREHPGGHVDHRRRATGLGRLAADRPSPLRRADALDRQRPRLRGRHGAGRRQARAGGRADHGESFAGRELLDPPADGGGRRGPPHGDPRRAGSRDRVRLRDRGPGTPARHPGDAGPLRDLAVPLGAARTAGGAGAGVPELGRAAAQERLRALARAVCRHGPHLPGQGGRSRRAATRRPDARGDRLGGGHAERAQRRGDAGAAAPLRGRRPRGVDAGTARGRLPGREPPADGVRGRDASRARKLHGAG